MWTPLSRYLVSSGDFLLLPWGTLAVDMQLSMSRHPTCPALASMLQLRKVGAVGCRCGCTPTAGGVLQVASNVASGPRPTPAAAAAAASMETPASVHLEQPGLLALVGVLHLYMASTGDTVVTRIHETSCLKQAVVCFVQVSVTSTAHR